MSSALAIAAVTAVLKDLLHNGIIDRDLTNSVGDVTVSALPPDRVVTQGQPETSQLNLFLYQVTPNSGWRNQGLPARSAQGERLGNPPLALDLHYLLTAYGAKDLHAEILLGYAMQQMHETPVLTRAGIRRALTPSPVAGGSGLPPTLEALATSELSEQLEQIRISPEPLDTEELSKLWAACQTHYRPTAAYQASVVLIENRQLTRPSLPVRRRKIVVQAARAPVIRSVEPQLVPAGAALSIRGTDLLANIVEVAFATGSVIPTSVRPSQIDVVMPTGLLAGIQTVSVKHPLDLGTPNEPHQGFSSNLVAFMLTPRITNASPIAAIVGTPFTLTIEPPVGRAQTVDVLIGSRAIRLPARDPAGPATSGTLSVTLPTGFPAGSHLLRVQVDSAESPLVVNPVTQAYTGPLLDVT
ncbi:MAG TPA: DUF4255 domain-containing protein [Longimicrobiales bacterium]|nr:DUF4255 domain-containing protein [Longimicrobiales bacterium]